MRDVLDPLTELWSAGGPVALATVVGTYSSAPRQAGASMLVAADGRVVGSVSGGCVEGAVYELGRQVLVDGEPVLQRYGVSDDDAFTVGLTCGGIIDIFVERIDTGSFPRLADLARAISAGEPLAVGLREIGVSEHEISRMCSPIGLDLGARTPEQTAVSIAAEIVLRHFGGTGLPLGAREGAIHEPDGDGLRTSA
jgi:xanthine dehydrogenase accessory factor